MRCLTVGQRSPIALSDVRYRRADAAGMTQQRASTRCCVDHRHERSCGATADRAAVRQAAILVGAPIYAPRKGGGLNLRTLDELLRDATLTGALSEDITTYLRALLTDARAWNIRNKICHGMADQDSFNMLVADRVLHAALTIALLQEDNRGDGQTSPRVRGCDGPQDC